MPAGCVASHSQHSPIACARTRQAAVRVRRGAGVTRCSGSHGPNKVAAQRQDEEHWNKLARPRNTRLH